MSCIGALQAGTMGPLTWHAKLEGQVHVLFCQWWAKSIYQILNGICDQKWIKKHCSKFMEFRNKFIWLLYRVLSWERQPDSSSLKLTWLLYFSAPLGEESVLPLLTQDSNSKARKGILRRAVFSEDQRKALEKMFQKQKYISKTDRKKLAINLGLKESQVGMSRLMSTAPDFWRNSMKAIHLANICCTQQDCEALLKSLP